MMKYLVVAAALCAAGVSAEPAAVVVGTARTVGKPVPRPVKPAAKTNRLTPGSKSMINPQPLPPKILKPAGREQ